MGVTFAAPQHKDGFLLQIPRSFFSRHKYCSSAVAYNATVEQVEWIGNHARVKHILNRYWLTVHSKWIEHGMAARYDRDFSQLFRGSAILIHVTVCSHSICSDQRITIGRLVRIFGNGRGTRARAYHPPTARKLGNGVRDQRYIALTCADRPYAVIQVCLELGSTDRRGVSIAWKTLQIFPQHD